MTLPQLFEKYPHLARLQFDEMREESLSEDKKSQLKLLLDWQWLECFYFTNRGFIMSRVNLRESKQRYLEEYEKYKDVELTLNETYSKKAKQSEKVQLVEIDETANVAIIRNLRTENTQIKTLHWCRKNLIKE